MTSASRDLAVLGEQLAVLGVPSHVTVSSEAAVLIAGRDLVTVAHGRYWWRTGRVRQGRDVLRHHAVSDPPAGPGAWPVRWPRPGSGSTLAAGRTLSAG